MNQLTDVFYVPISIKGPAISDYNKRLILLSVIQLSGGQCIKAKSMKQFRMFDSYNIQFQFKKLLFLNINILWLKVTKILHLEVW